MTDRRMMSGYTEMEEGSPRGATGFKAEYGARLSSLAMEGATGHQAEYRARLASLAMEIAQMDTYDQGFLRSLLPATPERVTPTGHGPDIPVPGGTEFRHSTGDRSQRSWGQVEASSGRPVVAPVRNPWTSCTDDTGLGQATPVRDYGNPYTPFIPHMPPPPHYTTPVPPKFAMFSGEGQKNEPSYAQWRSEVQSVWQSGIYQDAMLMTNVRRSLWGRAADVLLAMGSDVSGQQLLQKLDVRFGDVRPSDMTLEQFFTARQLPAESVSAWGCRLEDLLSRVTDSRSAAAARTMLRSCYWSGLCSDKIRNALRHHFDEGADFEALLRQAHITEQEPSGATVQQAVTSPSQDKLDAILKQLTEPTTRVQTLETKLAGMERPSTSSMHESQVLPSVSNPGSSGMSTHWPPRPHSSLVNFQDGAMPVGSLGIREAALIFLRLCQETGFSQCGWGTTPGWF